MFGKIIPWYIITEKSKEQNTLLWTNVEKANLFTKMEKKFIKKKVKEKGGVLVRFFCLFNHYFISLAILSLVTIWCYLIHSTTIITSIFFFFSPKNSVFYLFNFSHYLCSLKFYIILYYIKYKIKITLFFYTIFTWYELIMMLYFKLLYLNLVKKIICFIPWRWRCAVCFIPKCWTSHWLLLHSQKPCACLQCLTVILLQPFGHDNNVDWLIQGDPYVDKN